MLACSSCGAENRAEARFCDACGSALTVPAPERRKLATLLFCDMSGSTALGERVDAESVRELMFRYFHTMREAIERHGGTVEKFVGDAVMAVFGVPVAHEDDALRAVRAAWEMQARLVELNRELERRVDVTIALRIGLNTGEVVAGDASSRQTIVTGDAVNTAARLEQAAQPGQILLGEPTYRLVRDAVTVEPVDPIQAKGKTDPVPAYRLSGVRAGAPGRRRLDSELVGRDAELELLLDAWARVTAERTYRLVTLVGEPGVGKSRLARELADRVGAGRVLSGRCLSYGEGITWWPVAEIVREAAGIRDGDSAPAAVARINRALAGDAQANVVSSVLAQAVGLSEGAATVDEIGWAVRRLFVAVARTRPTLVVVDDIQWAEEVLLELLAGLAAPGRHEPLLCLCLARPELFERRADWPDAVRLEPLAGGQAELHVRGLVVAANLDPSVADQVVRTAGGNPLFAEELVAMLRDEPLADMPASLSALLADRLDRLAESERGVLECGSVEGEVFHRGAVRALADHDPAIELEALCEKAFVRPARAGFADEAAFRFRHLLVRDAAYNATAKRTRAQLHESFADWLERVTAERIGEVEEIVGYHLEQACRYLEQLGPLERPDLTARAAERLAAAGRRAAARGDAGATANLLGRAASLLPADDPAALEMRLELAIVLSKRGDEAAASAAVFAVEEHAARRGDTALASLAELERRYLKFWHGGGRSSAVLAAAASAEAQLEHRGSGRWRAHVLARAMTALVQQDRLDEAVETGRRALPLTRNPEVRSVRPEIMEWLALALAVGPAPLEESEAFARELLADDELGPSVEWLALLTLALARGPLGHLEEARTLVGRAKAIATELGLDVNAAATSIQLAQVELLAGDVRDAEAELREAAAQLTKRGAANLLASIAAYLALLLGARGELDEALELAEQAERLASPEDVEVRVMALGVTRARFASASGAHEQAEAAARSALPKATSGHVFMSTLAYETLGDVLRAAGREPDAVRAYEQALQLHERKGHVLAAERLRKTIGAPPRLPLRPVRG